MKKVRLKVYIVFIMIFLVSLFMFGYGYIYLNSKYVSRQVGNSFVNATTEAATNINNQVNVEYFLFKNLVDEIKGEPIETKFEYVNSNKFRLFYLLDNDFKLGYIQNNKYILQIDDELKEFEKNELISQNVFSRVINIEKFSDILVDYTHDDTTYIIYQYKDLIIYYNVLTLSKPMLKVIDGITTDNYFIFETDGNILLDEYGKMSNKKLYDIFTLNYKFSNEFNEIAVDLNDFTSGYRILNKGEEKTYFVYSPIFNELLSKPFYIGYTIEFNDAGNFFEYSKNRAYYQTILLVASISLFIIFNVSFFVIVTIYQRSEENIQISKISHHFIRPVSVMCNNNGELISINKSFKANVLEADNYKKIEDFNIYNREAGEIEVDKDGTILTPSLSVVKQESFTTVLKDVNGNDIYIHFVPIKIGPKYLLIGEDETLIINEEKTNKRIAYFNRVTKLPNKIILDRVLNQMIDDKILFETNNSLIAIDVMSFDKINKMFGFDAADEMLLEMNRIIVDSLKGFEFKYELFNIRTSLFMLLIKDVKMQKDIIEWSKLLIDMMVSPRETEEKYLSTIDVKLGIFNIEGSKMSACNAEHIENCAQIALEKAKQTVLQRSVVYSSEFSILLTRDQIMENDLKEAVVKKEFSMYFQPQYNTKEKRICGFEALIRWNNPKYKNESVEHYITIAEKNGLIVDIGRFIIDQTFQFAKKIEDTNIHVSMNVSPVQLLYAGFVFELIESFKKYELKRGSIALEITETFMMENSSLIISKIKSLRDNGFTIHLDDFGIGYSSLLYLKDLPVDMIKIDKEFTKTILIDKYSRVIVNKIIQIALNLDLNIIAEGVETEKQSEMLSKMGCEIIQGYLISKAVNEKDAIDLIKRFVKLNDQEMKLENKTLKKTKKVDSKKEEKESIDVKQEDIIDITEEDFSDGKDVQ